MVGEVKGRSHIVQLSGVEVLVLQVFTDVPSGAEHAMGLQVDLA